MTVIKQNEGKCLVVSWIVDAVLFVCLLAYGLKSISVFESTIKKCMIQEVHYPTSIPQTNPNSNPNFHRCDCGHECSSDLGYCIRVFATEINSSAPVRLLSDEYEREPKCTFTEQDCLNGELIGNRIKMLQTAYHIAFPYIYNMNNSIPLDCYEYNDELFLKNDPDTAILTLSLLGGLATLLTIINCFALGKITK